MPPVLLHLVVAVADDTCGTATAAVCDIRSTATAAPHVEMEKRMGLNVRGTRRLTLDG